MQIEFDLNSRHFELLNKEFGKEIADKIIEIIRKKLCELCGLDMDLWLVNHPNTKNGDDCFHDIRVCTDDHCTIGEKHETHNEWHDDKFCYTRHSETPDYLWCEGCNGKVRYKQPISISA